MVLQHNYKDPALCRALYQYLCKEVEEEEEEKEEVEEKTGAPALDLGGDEEGETTVTEKPEETSTRAFNPVRMRDNRKK